MPARHTPLALLAGAIETGGIDRALRETPRALAHAG
jgi:hypothetical protein